MQNNSPDRRTRQSANLQETGRSKRRRQKGEGRIDTDDSCSCRPRDLAAVRYSLPNYSDRLSSRSPFLQAFAAQGPRAKQGQYPQIAVGETSNLNPLVAGRDDYGVQCPCRYHAPLSADGGGERGRRANVLPGSARSVSVGGGATGGRYR